MKDFDSYSQGIRKGGHSHSHGHGDHEEGSRGGFSHAHGDEEVHNHSNHKGETLFIGSKQIDQFDIREIPKKIKIITGDHMERACSFLKPLTKEQSQNSKFLKGLKDHAIIRICELAKCKIFKKILSIIFWLYICHLQKVR